MVAATSRCTPPIPPVANTAMPVRQAQTMVAAAVVAPCSPRARTIARSRRLVTSRESKTVLQPPSLVIGPTVLASGSVD